MRIAIVGSGIAGLTAAHHLHRDHDITLFEADDRLGGHTNTVRVDLADETHDVDTGFIVHNRRNYPEFCRLIDELGIDTRPSDMSLSFRIEAEGLEWGTNPRRLFAQPANVARPRFLRMLAEIPRWHRLGADLVARSDAGTSGTPGTAGAGTAGAGTGTADGTGFTGTARIAVDPVSASAALEPLGDFVARHRFRQDFVDWFLVPMGAAIWSADPATFLSFPALTVARFLQNHGMLGLGDRPQWRTVVGGSRTYVDRLVAPFADRVHTGTAVHRVRRHATGVTVCTARDEGEFDRVVLALHSDQALGVLADADPVEREVVGAIRYQPNVAVLHTDASLLPRRRRAWASWNCHVLGADAGRPTLTYHMNRLQGLESRHQLCVTLNREDAIDPATVLGRFRYAHPVFDGAAVAAQARRAEVQGRNHTYWCGAYWGYGFHEDGVRSGLDVVRHLRSPVRVAA